MDLSASLQALLADVLKFLPGLVAALVIFIFSLVLSAAAVKWIKRFYDHRRETQKAIGLVSQVVRIMIIFMGVILALEQVNFNVTGFVAGLGIAGFTIGFALQDISRNFIAGIILIIRQPFSIGDAIKVGDFSGSVREINLRDTVFRSWDGEEVIIPNQTVFGSIITNYSSLPLRRRTINFVINQESDLDHAMPIFLRVVKNVQGVLEVPQPTVLAEKVTSAGVQLSLQFWVDQTKSNLLEVHSEVVQAVREAAVRENISHPSTMQMVQID